MLCVLRRIGRRAFADFYEARHLPSLIWVFKKPITTNRMRRFPIINAPNMFFVKIFDTSSTPSEPGSPSGPGGPCLPGAPFGPCGPGSPGLPGGPFIPSSPGSPGGP
mmetsp:Transcript_51610/g.81978  ORF Transcript_51610/g.81978 Transcript_51610/m.81978 type:complete len:107 (-) Transcript_51610:366-686(-)